MTISKEVREQVQQRANYACEFCGVRETDVGGTLTVDHYQPNTARLTIVDVPESRFLEETGILIFAYPSSIDYQPQSRGGSDNLENLIYSCACCNQYKQDYWSKDESLPKLWNPRSEHYNKHFIELEDGQLLAVTTTGELTSNRLRLNRPPLIAYRLQRRRPSARTIPRFSFVANSIKCPINNFSNRTASSLERTTRDTTSFTSEST